MKIIRGGIYGIIGGLLYAFISFYLITPILRKELLTIAFFGLQGLIFGVVFVSLKLISNKINKKGNLKFISNLTIGAVSGFLSCIYNNTITYYNVFINVHGLVHNQLRKNIISELVYGSLGFVLMGLVIGFIIVLFETKRNEDEKAIVGKGS